MAFLQSRRGLIIFLILASFSISSFIYVFRISSPTLFRKFGDFTNKRQKYTSNFYQINGATIDFSHATDEFKEKLLDYFITATPNTSLLNNLFSKQKENNSNLEVHVKEINSTNQNTADIFVMNTNIADINLFKNTTSYLIIEHKIDFFNSTFNFVDQNRQWNHLLPPIIFVDNVTRINLFFLDPPIILLKRADSTFREIIDELWELQHPENCSSVVFERIHDIGCGLGCSIHWIHHGFNAAYNLKRPYVVPGYRGWVYTSKECLDHYMCYFLPIPLGCEFNDSTSPKEIAPAKFNFKAKPQDLHLRSAIHFFGLKLNTRSYVNILATYSYLEEISGGSFYPCISVHIRRGDKSLEVEPTPVGEYVHTVRKIADTFDGKWSLLLLTDDNSVKKEFIDQLSNQFPIYEINTSVTREFNWKMNYYQGLDALTEAYLASACDHFVGTLSSNLGRLILEIRHAQFPGITWSLDHSYQLFP